MCFPLRHFLGGPDKKNHPVFPTKRTWELAWNMDAAWQVSIMKKISLYLRFRLHWRYIAHFCKIQSGDFEL